MASYTTNLNLKKPAGSENVAIGDINNNMDLIDNAYGTLNTNFSNFNKVYSSPTSFDDISQPGIHYINGIDSFYGTLIVTTFSGNINQIRIQNNGYKFEARRYNGTTWTEWVSA